MRALRRGLIAADVLGTIAAFAAAWLLFDAPLLYEDAGWEPYALLSGGLAAWVVAAWLAGHYRDRGAGSRQDLANVARLVTVGAWALVVSAWLTGKPDPDVRQLLAFWLVAIAAITAARGAVRIAGRADAAARPAPFGALLRRIRRRLALVDCAVLFVVLTACRRIVDEPLPGDSAAWAWVFVALSLPLWAAAATALGHYERERASTRRDLVGTFVLASGGAWLLVALAPYTGEVDPDVAQLTVVWICTIATVAAARQVARG